MSRYDPREIRNDWARRASAATRDIGEIPEIEDVSRRTRCIRSLRTFCEVYFSDAFPLDWSQDHIRVLGIIEESAIRGALFAFAMPRGSGKTTICRVAALWAMANCHCRFACLLGANADKAEDSLDAIKVFCRFSTDFSADFPEISHAVIALGGVANRAGGQLCLGFPTLIEWSKTKVVLPTVPVPPNWPSEWPNLNGMAPTSGSILVASGLTADGIRGSVHATADGRMLRPDFVLLDDPQTDESASSNAQNATRERLISGAVLGMAGPGKAISAVMPCTVIRPGDMVDCILDRDKHPLWRGQRTKMLTSMPDNMQAWSNYFEVYRRAQVKDPPDIASANSYYVQHRDELDSGAVASWPSRKLPDEVSAIQHAMHLYCRDPGTFWAEFQNSPQSDVSDSGSVRAKTVMTKRTARERWVIPAWSQHVTSFVDVHDDLLYWLVAAWDGNSTGAVVAYGSYPDQRRSYFTLRDSTITLRTEFPDAAKTGAILAGIRALATKLFSVVLTREDDVEVGIDRMLIDSGYLAETVYEAIVGSAYRDRMTPSRGRGITARSKPLSEWTYKAGDRRGHHWGLFRRAERRIISCEFDANFWKSRVRDAWNAADGDIGALTIHTGSDSDHRCYSEHISSEYPKPTEGLGRRVEEWQLFPGMSDNHWLDCTVGTMVAASIEGMTLPGISPAAAPQQREVVKLSEMRSKKKSTRAG